MRNNNSITQKVPMRNRSTPDQDRDINGRFISSQGKKSYNTYRNKVESKLSPKQSYNGGSTYGEHQ